MRVEYHVRMNRRNTLATPSRSRKSEQLQTSAETIRSSKRRKAFMLLPTVSLAAVLDGTGGGDRSFRQLLYDISIAASHLESARAYLASNLGVTSPQYNMLMVVAQYEGSEGISINEIADHLHVSNTFITTELKKLVRDGLVVKDPNPSDARSVLVRLSTQGEEKVRALHPELLFVNDHLFQNLSASDFKALSRIIASLIGDFSQTVAMLQVVSQSPKRDKTRDDIGQAIHRGIQRSR